MLKREKNPKILKKFLNSVCADIERLYLIPIEELFPAEIAPAGEIEENPDLKNMKWEKAEKNSIIIPDGKKWWIKKIVNLPEIKNGKRYGIKFKFGEITESLLYLNGKIYSGISTGMWDDKKIVSLPDNLKGKVEILIHLYSGKNFGTIRTFGPQIFECFTLYEIDTVARDLYYAFSTALDVLNVIDENSENYHKILKKLEDVYLMLDFTDENNYRKSCLKALKYIEKEIYNGKDLKDIKFFIFGHAHIDVAWLWTLDNTKEKTVRTFSSQISQMEKFSDWIYQQGQSQLYKFIEEKFPKVFKEIIKKVKEGRWETSGGCWVEFDTNIPSGESLIRQILYGKNYFKEKFGIDCKVLWLPDVFGYSGSLPQILKKSGIDLFITTKISWNQYTRFPYDTFYWKGIDGSKVLTHFITTPTKAKDFHTYNTTATPTEIYETYLDYQQKNINNILLMPYGFGDGGGGPKESMLNRIKWIKKGIEGFVKVEDGGIEKFREEISKNIKKKDTPVYEGELYLEFHRGTYTTQTEVKKKNRKNEFLLRDAEVISILSGNEKESFEKLKENWLLLLLNQFHDILPGSSTKEVYRDTLKSYEKIEKETEKIIEKSMNKILKRENFYISVFNPFSWNYTGYLKTDFEGYIPENLTSEVDGKKVIIRVEDIPPFSFKNIKMVGKKEKKEQKEIFSNKIENDFYKIKIDKKTGRIISLIDKREEREICDENGINIFEIFEDKSIVKGQDAWDIEYMHQFKCYEKDGKVEKIKIEKGMISQKVIIKKKILNSTILQEIIIYKEDPIIYFETEVDWKEEEKVLKVAFPLQIHTDYATCDIQFGSIKRPTHRNTLYEHAKFEIPAHKWVDLSEGFYGVSILSDSKYGFGVKENVIRITLLRSPLSPDPTADRRKHKFSYGLYPHQGGWEIAEVPKISYQFNNPPRIFKGKIDNKYLTRIVEIKEEKKGTNLIVETIKISEDKKGIIVRIYECKNSRGKANIKFNFPGRKIKKIYLCDNMENNLSLITDNYNTEKGIEIEYMPFELINLKLICD